MISELTRVSIDKLIKEIAEDPKTKNSPTMVAAIAELLKGLKG